MQDEVKYPPLVNVSKADKVNSLWRRTSLERLVPEYDFLNFRGYYCQEV